MILGAKSRTIPVLTKSSHKTHEIIEIILDKPNGNLKIISGYSEIILQDYVVCSFWQPPIFGHSNPTYSRWFLLMIIGIMLEKNTKPQIKPYNPTNISEMCMSRDYALPCSAACLWLVSKDENGRVSAMFALLNFNQWASKVPVSRLKGRFFDSTFFSSKTLLEN